MSQSQLDRLRRELAETQEARDTYKREMTETTAENATLRGLGRELSNTNHKLAAELTRLEAKNRACTAALRECLRALTVRADANIIATAVASARHALGEGKA